MARTGGVLTASLSCFMSVSSSRAGAWRCRSVALPGGPGPVREGEEGIVVLHGDLSAAERAHDAVDGGGHAKIL